MAFLQYWERLSSSRTLYLAWRIIIFYFIFSRRECLRRLAEVSTRGIIIFSYVRTTLYRFYTEHSHPRRHTTSARSALGAQTTDTDTVAVQRATS